MSDLFRDLSIWTLLGIAVGFAGIGLMGLLIFPDTRSRMYTAFRASLMGLGALVLSVILYGIYAFQVYGENQYLTLVLHSLLLLFVVVCGNRVMYGFIRTMTARDTACQLSADPVPDPGNQK